MPATVAPAGTMGVQSCGGLDVRSGGDRGVVASGVISPPSPLARIRRRRHPRSNWEAVALASAALRLPLDDFSVSPVKYALTSRLCTMTGALLGDRTPSGSTCFSKRSWNAWRAFAVRAAGSAVFAQLAWAAIRDRRIRSSGLNTGMPPHLVSPLRLRLKGLPTV